MDNGLRELWKDCFGDTDSYIRFYFSEKVVKSRVYTDYDGEKLASMAFFTPYPVVYRGLRQTASYIVGVATRGEYRHQGRMTRLIRQGISRDRDAGNALVYLSPADTAIYEPLGFRGVYWRQTTYVDTGGMTGGGECRIMPFARLDHAARESVADFGNRILEEEGFDLYIYRSGEYYETVSREMQALAGDVLVFYCGNEIAGVAGYIREEGRDIVTELICQRSRAEAVVETLARFVPGEEIRIEDSYFISRLNGKHYRREPQGLPYIMCRMLAGGRLPEKCYINDIT